MSLKNKIELFALSEFQKKTGDLSTKELMALDEQLSFERLLIKMEIHMQFTSCWGRFQCSTGAQELQDMALFRRNMCGIIL